MTSDELFNKIIMQDISIVFESIWKIFSGLFLSPDGLAVTTVFLLGSLFVFCKIKEL